MALRSGIRRFLQNVEQHREMHVLGDLFCCSLALNRPNCCSDCDLKPCVWQTLGLSLANSERMSGLRWVSLALAGHVGGWGWEPGRWEKHGKTQGFLPRIIAYRAQDPVCAVAGFKVVYVGLSKA